MVQCGRCSGDRHSAPTTRNTPTTKTTTTLYAVYIIIIFVLCYFAARLCVVFPLNPDTHCAESRKSYAFIRVLGEMCFLVYRDAHNVSTRNDSRVTRYYNKHTHNGGFSAWQSSCLPTAVCFQGWQTRVVICLFWLNIWRFSSIYFNHIQTQADGSFNRILKVINTNDRINTIRAWRIISFLSSRMCVGAKRIRWHRDRVPFV